MPTKHIPDGIWRKVEKEIVKAVIATQRPIKESEMIEILLNKGLESMGEKDYQKLKAEKDQK